jgi:hypothetical protein
MAAIRLRFRAARRYAEPAQCAAAVLTGDRCRAVDRRVPARRRAVRESTNFLLQLVARGAFVDQQRDELVSGSRRREA